MRTAPLHPTGYPAGSGYGPRSQAPAEHSASLDRSAWSSADHPPSSANQSLPRSACGRLVEGPGVDQCAIDAEMLVAGVLGPFAQRLDALEKRPLGPDGSDHLQQRGTQQSFRCSRAAPRRGVQTVELPIHRDQRHIDQHAQGAQRVIDRNALVQRRYN